MLHSKGMLQSRPALAATHAACAGMLLTAQLHAAAAHAMEPPRVEACKPKTACVSTASFQSPSQYLAPWNYAPTPRPAAQRQLVQEVESRGGQVLQSSEDVVVARIVYGPEDEDDVVFLFRQGEDFVLFSAQGRGLAARAAPPPACWTPGCVSGPRQRARMDALRDALGWTSFESDEDKVWQRILFH
eukprot:CAMPEP_0202883192 /NCGR_PEP_ID=MMETSP1391-20130828/39090_1 /ASSEMBLY_ACC=CAM_ASM_000867 /TAXON_ID=1034604 /ORGANISM="Chlamydomonas leiostraca, Strain SAG 11-49" /LENGTH=186 /DNA_ID=CAMNT_0049566171 /DNA_START=80 /DNA_END=640 /DNA_ORIENTATION=+